MRLKYSKLCTFLIIAFNIFLCYYIWKLFIGKTIGKSMKFPNAYNAITPVTEKPKPKDRIQSTNKHIKKTITIIFRDFYHFENDLKLSIESIVTLIPNVQILVIYDEEPYPPMDYLANYTVRNNVKLIRLGFDINKTAKLMSPIFQIRTKYVLILPDSVRLGGRSIIQKMLKEMGSVEGRTESDSEKTGKKENTVRGPKSMVVVPFSSNVREFSNCCSINIDFINWSIEYGVKNRSTNCDMFLQKHAIFIETATLKDMPDALSPPFPEFFYIQSKVSQVKKILLTSSLQDGKRLFTAFHNKQRRKEIRRQQFKEMYRKLLVKKVIRKMTGKPMAKNSKPNRHRIVAGSNGNIETKADNSQIQNNDNHINLPNNSLPLITTVEFYGCEKNTKSCVGTVFNQKPFYTYLDKHTPPCCLEKLKAVFIHIIEEFENVGIRYWLDNHALRSAIETNDLAFNAYEIDISFNVFDLERSSLLKKSQARPLIDVAGFYWIKATDGNYFRVQYSKVNQIGVNLLPFDLSGDRVVPTSFYGWKAKEFSAEFLHPMSTVVFLGKGIMCPNNVIEFLALKNIK
ncbi:hypothetical protein HA402_015956 [Bradysia odoriphaga]|nr:hypothetical protein HA402_015956 [Bradysia odoriphaga]